MLTPLLQLPEDPMKGNTPAANNYPLLAYTYLIRRFVMCPRFCLICFKCVSLLVSLPWQPR